MDRKMETFEDMLQLWKDDKEAATDLLYLSPDTVQLPYTSQQVLLTRLRFQFYTLTAMQKGMLSDGVKISSWQEGSQDAV